MENGDVRAETRQPWYSDTCALLKEMNRKCEVLSRGAGSRKGILPKNRQDIIIRVLNQEIDFEIKVQNNEPSFHEAIILTGKAADDTLIEIYQRDTTRDEYGLAYIPLFLDKGWHHISIKSSLEGLEKLTISLSGEQVPGMPGGKQVKYSKSIL